MTILKEFVFERVGVDSRIKGLDFIERTNTVCLDPADMLAFTMREQAIDENSVKSKLSASIMERRPKGGAISAEQLQLMVDEMIADGIVPGSELPQKFPKKVIQELIKNRYWRGPKL